MVKITGIRSACKVMQRMEKLGPYSPHYAMLRLNVRTGGVWADEYYDLGHGSYTDYASPSIVTLDNAVMEIAPDLYWADDHSLRRKPYTMKNICTWAEAVIAYYDGQ